MARERVDDLAWQRSKFCNGGTCLEVAVRGETVAVRSSRQPADKVLVFPVKIWREFITEVKGIDLR